MSEMLKRWKLWIRKRQTLELPLLLADALTGIELAYGNQKAINEQTEKLAILAVRLPPGGLMSREQSEKRRS